MPAWLSNLGNLLSSRFEHLGELDDLASAIAQHRRAVELVSEGDPHAPTWLSNLAGSLLIRFTRLGELEDLENAITHQRRAVDLTPEGHSNMPMQLNNYGGSLMRRFERLGELADLEGAISALRRAVDLARAEDPHIIAWLNNLGGILQRRYNRLGTLEDLESAIFYQRRAISLMPEGHPKLALCLDNHGAALRDRFNRLGDLGDLEDAIVQQRSVVRLTSEQDPTFPFRLDGLGGYLTIRFERLGEIGDLENAVVYKRRAVELIPPDHANLPLYLDSLGGTLQSRFERFGALDDLEDTIRQHRRAIELTPETHVNKPKFLNSLGSALQMRFVRCLDPADLDSAIFQHRHALELTPEGHSAIFVRLNYLAYSAAIRYKYLKDPSDLEASISQLRRAIELAPEGYFKLSLLMRHLALGLRARFDREQNKANFDAAVEAYEAAVLRISGEPTVRLECAKEWVVLESAHHEYGSTESRLRAHSCVVDVLPEIVWLGHSIDRRYAESADVAGLVNGAVSAAIELQQLSQAVEWLEAGRGLIWSQVLSLRTPVDDLAQHHPKLAATLQDIMKQLQNAHLLHPSTDTSRVDALSVETEHHHRRLVIQYEHCLKEIRACSGFESFLRPSKLTSLALSLDGPVIFINVHSSRCDALALFPDGALKTVPLPSLTYKGAQELQAACTRHLEDSHVRARGSVPRDAIFSDKNSFRKLLGRLWTWIVRPILDALEFSSSPERLPHVTWCPTGPLTQLPLHAAGIHRPSGPSGPHVFDFVVSSYTPSLSTLLRARDGLGKHDSPPNTLIITQPATPGLPPLSGTEQEGERLQAILFEAQIESTIFSGAQATVSSVQSVMGQFSWLHLACHGVQDPIDPTQSAFMLHDGGLTLSDLMRTTTDSAELAFLSACQTAAGDERIPEESAHLAAGMLAVGFKGVVATMWSIGDADAPIIVEAYYKKLLELRGTGAVAQGNTGAAYALHEAVKTLREEVGEASFLRWVPFVHYGL